MKNSFERIKKYFASDTFAACNKIEIISIDFESARCKVAITERSFNAENIVQGGLIYTLADFTFAAYANYTQPICVTQSGTISYVRPASSENKFLYARARKIEKHNRNLFCEVLVEDEQNKIIAIAHFTGFIKPLN